MQQQSIINFVITMQFLSVGCAYAYLLYVLYIDT
jgi:hypothetical protein